MRITATQPLFAWATLEDSPSLETVRRCLEAIPDASLLQGLRQARGHGRDDYPVSVLWGGPGWATTQAYPARVLSWNPRGGLNAGSGLRCLVSALRLRAE